MKLFELHRDEDESGISGTGVVAQGVIFDNGRCSLSWLTEHTSHTSAAFYTSIEEVIAIHGHDGKTRVMQVVDCSSEAINGIIGNCYQDNCENVHVGLKSQEEEVVVSRKDGTTNSLAGYLWDERQKFYNLFTPINLATGSKFTGGI